MYRIEWSEVSEHRIDLSPEQAAELLGITVDELGGYAGSDLTTALSMNDVTDGLADALANVQDADSFIALVREDIEITRIGEQS